MTAWPSRLGRAGRTPDSARGARVPVLLAALAFAAPAALAGAPVARGGGDPIHTVDRAVVALRGVTLDVLGRVVGGVQILVAPGDPDAPASAIRRVTSDASGKFRIEGLAPGSYRLVAAKSGYSLLVSRIDTFVQSSIDLVLRPAGQEPAPGMRPRDASWVLRLPGRDILEDRRPGSAPAQPVARRSDTSATASASRRVEIPLSLRLDGARESGAGAPDGPGYGLEAAGTLASESFGTFDLRFGHARLGDAGGRRDDADRLAARWVGPPGGIDGGFVASVSLDAVRRDRARGIDPDPIGISEREGRLALAVERTGSSGSFDASVEFGFLDHERQVPGDSLLSESAWSVGARAGYETTPRPGVSTALFVELVSVHPSDGGLRGDDPSVLASSRVSGLDALSGTTVRAGAEHRRRIASRLTVVAGAVAERDDDARGRPLIGRVESGLLWQAAPRLAFSARGGWSTAGTGSGIPVFSVAAEQSGENWSFRLLRERTVGGDDPDVEAGERQATIFFAAREATIDRWLAEARWDPGSPRWPAVAVRASWSSVEGAAAAHLPGDLIRLPVVFDARGSRRLVALDVNLARTGTSVALAVEDVDQRGGTRGFIGGTQGWTRRVVEVRQRLGERLLFGSNCYLLFGVTDVDLLPAQGQPAGDPAAAARMAVLDRRRISGGLAVAF